MIAECGLSPWPYYRYIVVAALRTTAKDPIPPHLLYSDKVQEYLATRVATTQPTTSDGHTPYTHLNTTVQYSTAQYSTVQYTTANR